jgi:NAD(P)-dependent dehydrogenase (short-subunit alcohol dehydrogenase family)
MPDTEIAGATALVTGAELRAELGDSFTAVTADAADPNVDVQHAFNWTREALLAPLPPGSTVILMSSGAAVFGSPLSGGYPGAKAAIRFLGSSAASESARAGLGIRFVSLLPQLTPSTALGAVFAAAYSAREGGGSAARTGGQPLTPDQVGQAVTGLITSTGDDQDAYLVTPAGLRPVP